MVEYRKRRMDYRYLITLAGILLGIGMIIIIGRKVINHEESKESIPVISQTVILSEMEGFNISERLVLTMLIRQYGGSEPSLSWAGETEYLYYYYLKDYFSDQEYNPGKTDLMELENLIQAKEDIFRLEHEANPDKMSLDARELTLYIDQQIYNICGLSITFNVNNQIEQIKEVTGNILYQLSDQIEQDTIHMNTLIIVLITILILWGICIAVSRKNKLFVKEVAFDGFDEKEYA